MLVGDESASGWHTRKLRLGALFKFEDVSPEVDFSIYFDGTFDCAFGKKIGQVDSV